MHHEGNLMIKIRIFMKLFMFVRRTIDDRKKIIIAMNAACGMEYLHENNLTHFNLKSHNLLVNMTDPLRPVCKVSSVSFGIL